MLLRVALPFWSARSFVPSIREKALSKVHAFASSDEKRDVFTYRYLRPFEGSQIDGPAKEESLRTKIIRRVVAK